MWTCVNCSTVATISGGPPKENAALILLVPWPGIGTQESRGIETTQAAFLAASMCTSIIVSVR